MNISSLFASIGNLFKSEDVNENLRQIKRRLDDSTLPAVQECIKATNIANFEKNIAYSSMRTDMRYNYRVEAKAELFPLWGSLLKECQSLLGKLIELSDRYLTSVNDKDSMTYRKAQILALANAINLITDYIPLYCSYILCKQAEMITGEKVEDQMLPAQLKTIQNQRVEFKNAVLLVSNTDYRQLERMLNTIPDIIITDDRKEEKLVSRSKLDPNLAVHGLLSASTNPFYLIGMYLEDRAYKKYRQSQQELQAVKIDLDRYKAMQENGTDDVYWKDEQQKAQDRWAKLDQDIKKYEAKALDTRY